MNKIEKWHRGIILCLGFFLLYLANHWTLLTSDDYMYHFVFKDTLPTANLEKIHGIWSIIRSQYVHWQLWNGRYVSHAIVQFLTQFDGYVFDILNSLAFLTLIRLSCQFISFIMAKRISPIWYLLAFLYYWLFLPSFGQTALWLSGSVNYLWTSLFYLTFLLYFVKTLEYSKVEWYQKLSLFFLAFLAGACNENSSPTIILIAFVFLIYKDGFSKKICLSHFMSLGIAGLSFLTILLSPASQTRGQSDLNIAIVSERLFLIFNQLWSQFAYLYIGLLCLFCVIRFQKLEFKELELFWVMVLFVGHLVAAVILFVSPEIPDRTLFCSAILLGLTLGMLLLKCKWSLFLQLVVVSSFLVLFSMSYTRAIMDIHQSYLEVRAQYQAIEKSDPNTIVVVTKLSEPKSTYNAYRLTNNLADFPDYWFNQWMAAYFEVKGIVGIEK
ncbi:DUF3329 domain-containing protein [Streptococcus caprae]|uniref:DUF6056 family protein n=1 Tax=Streptococcus caprae TaxID=1640501 RepID=A0ABV8CSX2_9STRE